MPTPNERPSLSTDLETRYKTQQAGGAFNVKDVLKAPGSGPVAGTTIDATSMQGNDFQSPNGFEVRVKQGITAMKDAQGNQSKQLSTYARGLNNRKYHR